MLGKWDRSDDTWRRQSELLGLCWSDILWERSEIRLKETFVHGNHPTGRRTKLSRSTVVLHPVLLQLLKDWRGESIHAADTDYVFASVKNGGKTPRCGSMIVEDYLQPAAMRAKVIEVRADRKTYVDGEVVKRFGFHTLRHSLTSWMMEAGENPQIVPFCARVDESQYACALRPRLQGHQTRGPRQSAGSGVGK